MVSIAQAPQNHLVKLLCSFPRHSAALLLKRVGALTILPLTSAPKFILTAPHNVLLHFKLWYDTPGSKESGSTQSGAFGSPVWGANKNVEDIAGRSYDGALLLQLDTSTKKFTGKEFSNDGKQGVALKPCELKFQDLARHMVPLTCRSDSS